MTNNDIRAVIGSSFLDSLRPVAVQPIVPWAETNIDLSGDSTTSKEDRGRIRLRSYQVPVLEATDDPAVREITVVASPRLGKSLLWKITLAKRIYDGDTSAIVVYPSDELAADTNRDTVEPLLRGIPAIRKDLERPRSRTLDSYHFTECNSIVYFQGAGRQVISKSAGLLIADELDMWALPGVGQGMTNDESRNLDNLKALRIRGQTFADKLLFKSSTPTTAGGTIWLEFGRSSRGSWHLCCLNCGNLLSCRQLAFPLSNGTYAGLQWQKDEGRGVLPESIRYTCPTCGHSHEFAQAGEMVRRGRYVFEFPERTWHQGFHFNALCAPEVFSWLEIAESQEEATPGNLQARKYHRNYIMAGPYSPERDVAKSDALDLLKSHSRTKPKDEEISAVFAAVDVQGYGTGANYFVYCIRGYTETGCSFLLAHGIAQNLQDLTTVADGKYAGRPILFALIDQGGFDHSKSGLSAWMMTRRNWHWYKGDSQSKECQTKGFEISKAGGRLILANPYRYQANLLTLIYTHTTDTGEGYWMLPEDIDDDYLRQIRTMRPAERKANGEAYNNWTSGQDRNDYFDAEKMLCVIDDLAVTNLLPAHAWPKGNKPLYVRRRILLDLKRAAMAAKK